MLATPYVPNDKHLALPSGRDIPTEPRPLHITRNTTRRKQGKDSRQIPCIQDSRIRFQPVFQYKSFSCSETESLHSPVYPSHLQVHRLCNSKGSQNVEFLTAIAEGPLTDWQTTNCHLRQEAVTNVLSIQPSGKRIELQIQTPQLTSLQQNF